MPHLVRTLAGSLFLLAAVAGAAVTASAQTLSTQSGAQTLTVRVTDAGTGTPLAGATAVTTDAGRTVGAAADINGLARLAGLSGGTYAVTVSYVGYEPARLSVVLPLADPEAPVEVALEEGEESEEAVVTATRTGRTIARIPTRVEVVGGEEIDEKLSMDPSNISMLLGESPGIVVQQTSAVSANASIRIQGLDGRYTQLLKDGFPLYGGFSGGLSLLQTPPLDLAQVEIIKGPTSTLYGGDAIAGLVNLVTRVPGAAPERSLIVNATSAGGLDAGAYLSGRTARLGYTLLASANGSRAYDADGDAFTNLPLVRRLTLAPRGFWYPSPRTTLWVGLSGTAETREGGDVDVVRDDAAGYSERSQSDRLTSQVRLDHTASDRLILTLKQSATRFGRSVVRPGYRFAGTQTATYAEASAFAALARHDVAGGLDLRTDAFDQDAPGTAPGTTPGTAPGTAVPGAADLGYTHLTAGAFVQDTYDVSEHLAVELGLRGDLHDTYGVFALPRASLLVRATPAVSVRATGGLGYKAPTVFLEPSETRAFEGVLPLDASVRPERSAGGTIDVDVQTALGGGVTLSLNQAVFATRLAGALVPDAPDTPGSLLRYRNAPGPVWTRGLETNALLGLGEMKLFLGYVYLDATEARPGMAGQPLGRSPLALTPAHKTYSVLVWEPEGRGRVGLEVYYTGPQRLTSGERTPGYLVAGLMGEWRVGRARVFLNLENLLDTQQTNYGPVVLGPRATPTFADVWAPTDGFVANGGVKLSL